MQSVRYFIVARRALNFMHLGTIMVSTNTLRISLAFTIALSLPACSDSPVATNTDDTVTALFSVQPTGGARGVEIPAQVRITFTHPLPDHMTTFVDMHHGGVDSPTVDGTWSFTPDHMTLMFEPGEPLHPGMDYTIHLGGGMGDTFGRPVDLGTRRAECGGEWALGSMFGRAGMPGGGHGWENSGHVGNGWAHTNGSYGMMFGFTTVLVLGGACYIVALAFYLGRSTEA